MHVQDDKYAHKYKIWYENGYPPEKASSPWPKARGYHRGAAPGIRPPSEQEKRPPQPLRKPTRGALLSKRRPQDKGARGSKQGPGGAKQGDESQVGGVAG